MNHKVGFPETEPEQELDSLQLQLLVELAAV